MELDFQGQKFIHSTWGGNQVVILFDHDDDEHFIKQLEYLLKEIKGEDYGFGKAVVNTKMLNKLKIRGNKLIIT